jgi:hypothetical protein
MFSMMSISPQPGQPAVPMSAPSIQNAGQRPCPRGTWMRASTRPWVKSNLPRVTRRAEVYWQAPYQHWYCEAFCGVAVSTSAPPSWWALSGSLV